MTVRGRTAFCLDVNRDAPVLETSAMNIGTIIFWVSMVWLASEILLAFLWRSKSTDIRRDKSSQKIIWIVVAISFSVSIFFKSQRFGHFGAGSMVIPNVGIALIVCGMIVRWIATFSLRRQFTVDVAIIEGHRLVTKGIYRYLRHPIYSGILLAFVGLGLSFANFASLVVIAVPITAAFLHRIKIEERALLDHFGAEYQAYCASTKRLIPFVY